MCYYNALHLVGQHKRERSAQAAERHAHKGSERSHLTAPVPTLSQVMQRRVNKRKVDKEGVEGRVIAMRARECANGQVQDDRARVAYVERKVPHRRGAEECGHRCVGQGTQEGEEVGAREVGLREVGESVHRRPREQRARR